MISTLPGEGSLLLLIFHQALCHVQVPERHPDLVSSVTASTQHKADTWDSVRSMRNSQKELPCLGHLPRAEGCAWAFVDILYNSDHTLRQGLC